MTTNEVGPVTNTSEVNESSEGYNEASESVNTENNTRTPESRETSSKAGSKASEGQTAEDTDLSPENIDEIEQTGPKTYEVVVNGEKLKVTEQELIQGFQTRKASDEKFRESAMIKKQAEEFITMLRKDPAKLLSNPKLGINFKQIAEKYLIEQMEEEMMDPKEKELRDAKRKLQQYEEAKQARQRQIEQQRAQEMTQHYTQDYSNQIMESIKASGLPESEVTVKRMAYYMYEGFKRNMELRPHDVAELVKEDFLNEQRKFFANAPDDKLEEYMGAEAAEKYRRARIAKLKVKGKPETPSKQGKAHRKEKSNKISKDEWKAKLERMKNGEE